MDTPELRPVFSGGRFEGAGFPVEALPELAAYGALLAEIAAHRHKELEGRQRAKAGFSASLGLRLTSVEDGSVKPVLACAGGVVDALRDAELEFIRQVEGSGPLPQHLRRRVRALGRSLKEGESIGLGSNGTTLAYDRTIRRRLLSRGLEFFEDDVDFYGVVIGGRVEQHESWVDVEAVGGGRPRVLLGREDARAALEAMADRLVHVCGSAEVSESGTIREVRQVDDMLVVDGEVDGAKTPLVQQFDELQSYGSIAPAPFRLFLELAMAEGIESRPYLCPTDDGTVEAEWDVDGVIATATLEHDESVYLHITRVSDSTFRDATVTNDYAGAASLARMWQNTLAGR